MVENNVECKGGEHYRVTDIYITKKKIIIGLIILVILGAIGFWWFRHYVELIRLGQVCICK